MSVYAEVRDQVRNGDIVFFSSHNGVGDWIIKHWENLVLKGLTKGIYSHIGTAYWLEKRLFLLEASFAGGVRMVPMSLRQPDKVVQMGFEWSEKAGDVAFQNMGKKYGKWDAIAAGLGMREDQDNEFICTEYVAEICSALGYSFPTCKQLPGVFFDQITKDGKSILTIDDPFKGIN